MPTAATSRLMTRPRRSASTPLSGLTSADSTTAGFDDAVGQVNVPGAADDDSDGPVVADDEAEDADVVVVVVVVVVVGDGSVVSDGVDDGAGVPLVVPTVTGEPVHGTPSTVNDVGAGLLPDQVPLKPTDTDRPVGTEPLWEAFLTRTVLPLWVNTPFHVSEVIRCPAVNVHSRVQPDSGSPRFVTVTRAPNPLRHWSVMS